MTSVDPGFDMVDVISMGTPLAATPEGRAFAWRATSTLGDRWIVFLGPKGGFRYGTYVTDDELAQLRAAIAEGRVLRLTPDRPEDDPFLRIDLLLEPNGDKPARLRVIGPRGGVRAEAFCRRDWAADPALA